MGWGRGVRATLLEVRRAGRSRSWRAAPSKTKQIDLMSLIYLMFHLYSPFTGSRGVRAHSWV